MHQTGSQEGVPVEGTKELQEISVEEIEPEAEAQECPNHHPSFFEKGKPRHLIPKFYNNWFIYYLQMFVALGCRSLLKTIAAFILDYLCLSYPCYLVKLSTLKCLGLLRSVEVGWFPVTCEI
jgi:hypothetical protein